MDRGSHITLMVGVITASVALLGYWVNQYIQRREMKAQLYADALQAIHDYEEMPYVIRHRPGSDEEVRATLAQRLSEVFARLKYHQNRLTMDSSVVGEAYARLFARTRHQGGNHREEAWRTTPVSDDGAMPGAAYYPYDNHQEFEACLLAMRRELSPWGPALRPTTRRRLRRLYLGRPVRREPEWMRVRRQQLLSAEQD
ncbi:hypothetical protein RM572_08770 [Streptomyces sp. DSM 42041]|uniref:Secreted protein n=1 Tax=Streptomyces hazeniae TaxID=3075538 RepID=A0ABU2NPG4_9ACTN|nr:hypothetical protein [Streptomyces sp. DSM 42041]MDT0378864.1 hypothetical protein [Streptomyces sp. DSM 42041]